MSFPVYQATEWQCRHVFSDNRCCGLPLEHEGIHWPAQPSQGARLIVAALRMIERHDAKARACNFEKCGCDDCAPFRTVIAEAEVGK